MQSGGFPIAPMEDIVIAEQIVQEKTAGGIIIPETAEGQGGKLYYAIVRAVGPGRYYAGVMNALGSMEAAVFVPTTVKVGQMVCFGEYQSGGKPLLLEGKKYLLFRQGDLIGIVTDADLADRIQRDKMAVEDPRLKVAA